MKNIVIYHKNCMDGLAAAAVLYNKLQGDAVFIPMDYVETFSNAAAPFRKDQPLVDFVRGATVYIVDFSLPWDTLVDLALWTNKIFVWDHHKSAIEKLQGGDAKGIIMYLDESMSGCQMVWRHMYGNDGPPLIRHVADRDLWKFVYPETKAFTSALRLETQTVEKYAEILYFSSGRCQRMIYTGETILKYEQVIIDFAVKTAARCDVEGPDGRGTTCICASSTVLLSEIGNALVEAHPSEDVVCVFFPDIKLGKIKLSFRSNKGKAKYFAEVFGGGGHPNAAGAVVDALPTLA